MQVVLQVLVTLPNIPSKIHIRMYTKQNSVDHIGKYMKQNSLNIFKFHVVSGLQMFSRSAVRCNSCLGSVLQLVLSLIKSEMSSVGLTNAGSIQGYVVRHDAICYVTRVKLCS